MDILEEQTRIYLSEYEKAQERAERRIKRCCVCGDEFDMSEGKVIPIWRSLHMEYHYICDGCIAGIEEIEE